MKKVGYLWNDKNIEIVEVGGEMYALNGWNGEKYFNCWKVLDSKGLEIAEEGKEYILKPVVQGVGEPDEEGYFDEYETIDYVVE